MKRKRDLCFGLLLLLAAGGCLHSCRQDAFDETIPGQETLLAQGRYLAARSADAAAAANDPDGALFAINTPYRLLAFTKTYNPSQPEDATPAAHPRFNKVAWEGATSGGLHFISLDEPDRWLGFAALRGEPAGSLASFDFYGFTYGKPATNRPPADYIELEGLTGENTPAEGSLASLKRTERVSADGTTLIDLLRGELFNQNIKTAGKGSATATQSILPFKHSFSKLQFYVAQQPAETPDENGDPLPCFPGIQLEKVEVTGTYLQGSVYLQDGKVELSGAPANRPLAFNEKYKGDVTLKEVAIGEMLVFPSDGAALKNADKADGYSVGLNITVRSTNRTDIEQFLANTDSPAEITTGTADDGTTYYRGTIVKKHIIENYTYNEETQQVTELRFKQNTRYRLVIWFKKDAVRIITVIPQVEEWLPGEGTEEDPWQEQAMGQPQMFDNIVWSDRNLGADHYDPMGADFENTVGYFYQSGRNIPYYPFDSDIYTGGKWPTPADKHKNMLADTKDYNNTSHRFYPMVDPEIFNDRSKKWMMNYEEKPQMFIPEEAPEDACYSFMQSPWSTRSGLSFNNYKTEGYPCDMKWNEGPQNQPVAGVWVIPTSSQFMAIFPSTPHAGNITFRAGGNNSAPMAGWGSYTNAIDDSYKTLRVTVPYYYDGMSEPEDRSDAYRAAWKTLKERGDAGTTHAEAYYTGQPGSTTNVGAEPDGDPEDGYASVYVLSRNEDSKEALPEELQNDGRFLIKSWGTIYAIKRVYTSQAYRLRLRAVCAGVFGTARNPGLYVEICRYRCSEDKTLTEENYMTEFDWEHPAARIYFPICGLGDWTGKYINFGTECQYATSDPIVGSDTSVLQMKITGTDAYNAYIAIIRKASVNRDFGKQIRPVRGGQPVDNE